jgi:hypothetical protein
MRLNIRYNRLDDNIRVCNDVVMERLYCCCNKVEITREGIDVKVKKNVNVNDIKEYISQLVEAGLVEQIRDYKVIIDGKLKRIEIWKDKQWIALYKISQIETLCILETIQKEIPRVNISEGFIS